MTDPETAVQAVREALVDQSEGPPSPLLISRRAGWSFFVRAEARIPRGPRDKQRLRGVQIGIRITRFSYSL